MLGVFFGLVIDLEIKYPSLLVDPNPRFPTLSSASHSTFGDLIVVKPVYLKIRTYLPLWVADRLEIGNNVMWRMFGLLSKYGFRVAVTIGNRGFKSNIKMALLKSGSVGSILNIVCACRKWN